MGGRQYKKKKAQHHQPRKLAATEAKQENTTATQTETQSKREKEPMPQGEPNSWIPAATLLTAVVVAVIYFLQWRAMIHTMDTTRQLSEQDERARIEVTDIPPLTVLPNQQLQRGLRFSNVGKTPARHFRAIIYIDVVPSNQSADFDYTKVRSWYQSDTGEIFANGNSDVPATRSRAKPGTKESDDQTEDWNLSPDEYQSLISGDTYIVTHGVAMYEDIFHAHHWKQFCTWKTISVVHRDFAAGICIQRNISDDNPEP